MKLQLYGIAIFLSAFLLFFIQPLIAKGMLPYFGGSGIVWISTILFFQIVLLLGYFYAYVLSRYFSQKIQAIIHLVLLCASIFYLPIHLEYQAAFESLWPPLAILLLLSKSILLPCVIICASSPLLQHWYCRVNQSEYPYIYYAISNAGSLIGLLGYPFLLEPLLGLKVQGFFWSLAYGVYVVLCIACLVKLFSIKESAQEREGFDLRLPLILKWISLTFLSSALLLSTTQFLVQNVMNLPLLWVLPLALYLISYIVVFAQEKPYDHVFWSSTFVVWLGLLLWLLYHFTLAGVNVVIVVLALLYSACMICHGELVKAKPKTQDLTLYYLMIALGGVLGGLFSNIIALQFFSNWWDLYVPLFIINGIVVFLLYRQYVISKSKWDYILKFLGLFSLISFSVVIYLNIYNPAQHAVAHYRNPYGLIKVFDMGDEKSPTAYRVIMHGMVVHGLQFKDQDKAQWPTTYYGHHTGIGLVFDYLKAQHPLQVGVIGLGSGILAAYGEKGDSFTFYEIDPDVVQVAHTYFSFMRDSKAKMDTVLGDARLQLQKNGSHKYNVLIVDAFSGDAIPTHLLTKEALSLYKLHLAKNGILAFHTSNTYLDFKSVTKALAEQQGCAHYWLVNNSEESKGVFAASWAIVSCDKHFGEWLKEKEIPLVNTDKVAPSVWTDDYNTILPLLKWNG